MARTRVADPLDELGELTKRQREVLELAAQGMTNAEIGARLGISKDGAKWHVGEILARLDVDTREEAIDLWRRYNDLPYRLHRIGRAMAGSAFLRWAIGGFGVTAVAVLGVVLAVLALQGSDNSKADMTPPATASSTTTPPATSTPESIDGIPVVAAHMGETTTLPAGTVLYIEGGCTGCENPARSLDRVIVGIDGEANEKPIYAIAGADNSGIGSDHTFITSIAASTNGYGLVVGVCKNGVCGRGGWKDTDRVKYFASNDGGTTWQSIGAIDGNSTVVAVESVGATTTTGLIQQRTQQSDATESSYVTLPGNHPSATTSNPDGSTWLKSGGNICQLLTGADSDEIALNTGTALMPDLPPGAHVTGAWNSPGGFAIAWTIADSTGATTYIGSMGLDDNRTPRTTGKPESAVRLERPVTFAFNGTMVDSTHALMTVGMTAREAGTAATDDTVVEPVVVDLKTGVMQPLGGYFLDRAESGDRTNILAVATGTFAEVHGTGDCLNVRAAASATAQSLGCYKDGVLLPLRGITLDADGRTWLAVTTPLNAPGWAAAEYLTPLDATPQPIGGYPASTRTGNTDVDPVLAAIESGEGEQIIAATAFSEIGCMVNPQGIGAPPTCPEGVADGTIMQVIPGGSCEGYLTPRAEYETNPIVPGIGMQLYAIYRNLPPDHAEKAFPSGDYTILYESRQGWASRVAVSGGKIVNRLFGCGETPAQVLSRPHGEFILPPK